MAARPAWTDAARHRRPREHLFHVQHRQAAGQYLAGSPHQLRATTALHVTHRSDCNDVQLWAIASGEGQDVNLAPRTGRLVPDQAGGERSSCPGMGRAGSLKAVVRRVLVSAQRRDNEFTLPVASHNGP